MPIYEYECKNCGYEWEEMQKITADPISSCPDCGQPKAKRLISRTNFVLKGSGWYVTDYGKGTGGQSGELKKKPKSKESKSEPKAEAKTETKTETKAKS